MIRTDCRPPPYLRAVEPQPLKLALSKKEAAAALGLSEDSFERHVQPTLKCNYVGARRLYRVAELDAWLARNAVSPGGPV